MCISCNLHFGNVRICELNLHVIYMSYTCHLPKIVYDKFTCDLHADYISFTCWLQFNCMYFTCRLHAGYMCISCDLHFLNLRIRKLNLHVIYMICTCYAHAGYMPVTCYLHVC